MPHVTIRPVEDETSVSASLMFSNGVAPGDREGCGLGLAEFTYQSITEEVVGTPNLDPEDCTILGDHFN